MIRWYIKELWWQANLWRRAVSHTLAHQSCFLSQMNEVNVNHQIQWKNLSAVLRVQQLSVSWVALNFIFWSVSYSWREWLMCCMFQVCPKAESLRWSSFSVARHPTNTYLPYLVIGKWQIGFVLSQCRMKYMLQYPLLIWSRCLLRKVKEPVFIFLLLF